MREGKEEKEVLDISGGIFSGHDGMAQPPIKDIYRFPNSREDLQVPGSRPPKGLDDSSVRFQESKETSDRPNEAGDHSGHPYEVKESLGRPSREQISAQNRSLKVQVAELRTGFAEFRECYEQNESLSETDREKLQRLNESVNFLCTYLEEKLSILIDVKTSEQDRIHIGVVGSLYLEDAAHSSQDLNELRLSETMAEQAKGKSAAVPSISALQRLIQRVAEKFGVLLSGLLTPKEWVLKGQLEATWPFFAKAGVSVEIKFGR